MTIAKTLGYNNTQEVVDFVKSNVEASGGAGFCPANRGRSSTSSKKTTNKKKAALLRREGGLWLQA